jgi:hypothetical protein
MKGMTLDDVDAVCTFSWETYGTLHERNSDSRLLLGEHVRTPLGSGAGLGQ